MKKQSKDQNTQKVFLISYNGDKGIMAIEEKLVSEDWESYMGPYSKLVPFAVGSNQELIDMETYNGNKDYYDSLIEKFN